MKNPNVTLFMSRRPEDGVKVEKSSTHLANKEKRIVIEEEDSQ